MAVNTDASPIKSAPRRLTAAAAIEIGKVAINIAEKHHELKDWQSGHELAFVFDAKKALS